LVKLHWYPTDTKKQCAVAGCDLLFRTGGVYPASECDPTNINHCVLAVGYNTTANPPYWIIRNSWGEDWGTPPSLLLDEGFHNQTHNIPPGMKGYIYLEFGKNACAVSAAASSALVVVTS
jgi:hypothetical protein